MSRPGAVVPWVGVVLWALALEAAAQAGQSEALALANQNGCLVCHGVDKKVVGPAWREVGRRYAGDAAAKSRLVAKVRAGGTGAWGNLPMPPNPAVKEEDLQALVSFVLSLR